MNENVILYASLGVPALVFTVVLIYSQVQSRRPRRRY
jgi:hypothetical protein